MIRFKDGKVDRSMWPKCPPNARLESLGDALDTALARAAAAEAENKRLREHLQLMEHGYRWRCNYCAGNIEICAECPPGECAAPAVRAALTETQ